MPESLDSLIMQQSKTYEAWFCACLLSGSHDIALSQCSWLQPSSFRVDYFGRYWSNILEGEDPIIAAQKAGLTDDLLAVVTTVPDLVRVEQYARGIIECQYLRQVTDGLQVIAKKAYKQDMDGVSEAIASLQAISPGFAEDNDLTPADLHNAFVEEIYDHSRLILTNIPAIDKRFGGLFAGELTTIASRPGMGKTALLLSVAESVAFSGKKVLLFSLEMSAIQLWARMACPLAGLEWKDVRSNNVNEDKLKQLEIESGKLRTRLGDNLIIIDDVYGVVGIHQKCAKYKPDLVCIDQLPDIVWHDPNVEDVKWYGLALKYLRRNIAQKMRCPLIVVHQINRGPEERKDKRPELSDLRSSGEVEQRSDVVWLCYRDDYYNGRAFGQVVVPFELNAAKNRQGSMGDAIVLNYDLSKQWFT